MFKVAEAPFDLFESKYKSVKHKSMIKQYLGMVGREKQPFQKDLLKVSKPIKNYFFQVLSNSIPVMK